MNELANMRLFSLLAKSSQEKVTNEEMQNAYEKFMEYLKTVGDSNDNPTAMRTLNFTRIELASLESVLRYEQGEKCPEKSVYSEMPFLS